ncbi:MAG: GNAT family N-acetyltransferase [Chloroflexota bacterium]
MTIKIVPMSAADYQAYLAMIIPVYAAEKVQAGNWTEAESLERSRQEYEIHLPQGIKTPGQSINNLVNELNEVVGFLWYGRLQKLAGIAFIYDFEIYAPFRRRGYAQQALELLAEEAKAQGFKRLELHVFGQNTAARELYRKAGYIETNVNMARDL